MLRCKQQTASDVATGIQSYLDAKVKVFDDVAEALAQDVYEKARATA